MEELGELAARHYGAFSIQQARQCSVSDDALFRSVRRGRLLRLHAGVFAFAGTPDTWERSVLAACLASGPDAVASHRAAARIWGLVEPNDDIVEITVPRRRGPRPKKVTVHRSTDLVGEHTTVRRRIPVTNPLRTMVDLGMRNEVTGPGRSGCGVLGRILDERALGDEVNDSLLEPRMARLLRRAGLPPAIFHYVIRTPGGVFLAEVDFAYPGTRLVIEVDGFHVHGTPRRMSKDFVRQNGLVPYGWHVLRFTWRQVVREPEMVARSIADSRAGLAAA